MIRAANTRTASGTRNHPITPLEVTASDLHSLTVKVFMFDQSERQLPQLINGFQNGRVCYTPPRDSTWLRNCDVIQKHIILDIFACSCSFCYRARGVWTQFYYHVKEQRSILLCVSFQQPCS